MLDIFFSKLRILTRDKELRFRILFVLGGLVLFRLLSAIPIPGIDALRLQQFLNNNQFFGLLNIFSGGGFSRLSIVMLGVAPYITSTIIMQLLTVLSPKLKALYHEEGEAGRKKFAMYSRLLTVPLAAIQAFGFLTLYARQGVLGHLSLIEMLINVTVVTAGSVLLMWIGELISEFGIGNGTSLIIFAGIVASLPTDIAQLVLNFDPAQMPIYIGMLAAAIAIVGGVVIVTEAERPIPIIYAKRVTGFNKTTGGVSTYLPLRVNQAGVIPIIFALSLLLFPQMIASFLMQVHNVYVAGAAAAVNSFLQNQWFYALLYFVLVFAFTYFYTAVTFDPESIATNLQKNGAFVPGVRPGQATAMHISKILSRLTLGGALFLGAIAVLPLAMRAATGVTAFTIGGTALLIAVSVVLDIVKKIDAQLSLREY